MTRIQPIAPVLLLEDLVDQIDESRARRILVWAQQQVQGQIFMTDTHSDRIPGICGELQIPRQHIYVQAGEALSMDYRIEGRYRDLFTWYFYDKE